MLRRRLRCSCLAVGRRAVRCARRRGDGGRRSPDVGWRVGPISGVEEGCSGGIGNRAERQQPDNRLRMRRRRAERCGGGTGGKGEGR
eukprot:3867496-Prymnesium_polylepis.1